MIRDVYVISAMPSSVLHTRFTLETRQQHGWTVLGAGKQCAQHDSVHWGFVVLVEQVPEGRCILRRDDVVFGGSGLSMMKMQMSVRESVAKVEEGIKFFARGLRLFGSDIATSGRLVLFAATGM